MKRSLVLALCLTLAPPPANALAARGVLDGSFNGGVASQGPADSSPTDVIIQPDGKVVVVGTKTTTATSLMVVTRYTSAGKLDPAFSGDGKMAVALGQSSSAAGVALQPDGRIVVVGTAVQDGANRIAVIRLTAGGSLDPTFDGDGRVITKVSGVSSAADVAVRASDGRIYVVGSSTSLAGGNRRLVLVRYLPSGAKDASFSGDGVVGEGFCGAGAAGQYVSLAPGKKVVAMGYMGCGTDENGNTASLAGVVRFTDQGTLDTSYWDFGYHGHAPFPSYYTHAGGVAVMRDGRVVGGVWWEEDLSNQNWGVFRTDGSGYDATFAYELATEDILTGVLLPGDGTVVLVGGMDDAWTIARLTGTLTPDTSFAPDGYAKLPISTSASAIGGAPVSAAFAGGRIVIVGGSDQYGAWTVARAIA